MENENETDNVFKEIDDYISDAVLNDDIHFDDDPKEQAEHELYVRSQAVKGLVEDYKRSIQYIARTYEKEINYSKENLFPWQWMKGDKRIRLIIGYKDKKDSGKDVKARYPLLMPMMNYLFNMNRKVNKKKVDLMKILANGEEYKDERPFACFVTNKDFWDDIIKTLEISESTAHRYIKGLLNINALRVLEQLKYNRLVLSDGYYLKYENGFRKISFVKNNGFYRKGLRAFKPV